MEADELVRGWTRTYSGDGVVLSVAQGSIHVRPRVTPVRPIREILSRATPPGAKVEGPFPLVTLEGEYGTLLNVTLGTEQATTAVIYGDTFYALVDGRTKVPEAHAAFRATVARLARGHSLGLGNERWRPYFYAPPESWQPVTRATSTLWLAPDCGRRHATLQVFHARPARASTGTLQYRRLFEQLSREYAAHRPEEPRALENAHAMIGQATTQRGIVGGEPMLATTASLSDGRLLYLARLETTLEAHDEHLPRLMEITRTMRPVPVAKTDIDVLIDWVD